MDTKALKAFKKHVEDALSEGCPRPGTNIGNRRGCVRVAVERLGIPFSNNREARRKGQDLLEKCCAAGLEPDWSLYTDATVAAGSPDVPSATERRRYEDLITDLKNQVRDLTREVNRQEDLKRAAFGISALEIRPPKWTLRKPSGGGKGKTVPILFCSDMQYAEVVKADDMDGLNEYNPEIAEARYRLMIEKAVYLCFEHVAKANYDGIIYCRGGDALSGGIHSELWDTDAIKPPAAVKKVIELESWGIAALRAAFGKVHVVSTSGNHGRVTVKPRSKEYADTNLEPLITWALEREYRDDPNVTFLSPHSGECLFEANGRKFLMLHGDRMGAYGGGGYIYGVYTVILRGEQKVRKEYSQIGRAFDTLLIGHFHTPFDLKHVVSNGSVIGYNEFARYRIRAGFNYPIQMLLLVHENGIYDSRELILQ